ncbi:MAG: hypothetical protein WC868_00735 [Bacteroidales bacterium]
MDRKNVEKAIKAKSIDKNGKLSIACITAFEIAEKFNVPGSEIGKICNELKIKIINCRLGCF